MGSLVCVDVDPRLVAWLAGHEWPMPVTVSRAGPDDAKGDLVLWNMSRFPRPLAELLGGRRAGSVIVVWEGTPTAEQQLEALRLGAFDALAKAERVALLVALRRFFHQAQSVKASEEMLQSLLDRSYSQSVLAEVLQGIPMSERPVELYMNAVRPLWETAGAAWGQLVVADGACYGDGPPLSDAAEWAARPEPACEETPDGYEARYPLVVGPTVVGALRLGGAADTRHQLEAFEPVLSAACGPIALAVAHLGHVEETRRQATRDGLTGLANHAHFQLQLRAEHDRASRYGQGFALVMLDLDHFKAINDTYGHQTGDRALKAVAELLRRSLRQSDLAARYGGEEFVALLPGTGADGARVLAERLRRAMHALEVLGSDDRPIGRLTGSLGVAVYRHGDSAISVLERADRALYVAKHGGRDQVSVAEEPLVEAEAAFRLTADVIN